MSTKQKKTIQKGSFKRLLKLFFFKNKMLTALMLFSIIIQRLLQRWDRSIWGMQRIPLYRICQTR